MRLKTLLLAAIAVLLPALAHAQSVKTKSQLLSEFQTCASQGLGPGCLTASSIQDFIASIVPDASNGFSAAGTTQGTAAALTAHITNVSTVTPGSGVILPGGVPGQRWLVFNTGTNPLNLYPASGAQISGPGGLLAMNAALSVAVNSCAEVVATTATLWQAVSLCGSGSGGGTQTQYAALGWYPGVNPTDEPILSAIPTAITLTSITGTPTIPTGQAGTTASVYGVGPGAPCSGGSVLHSGSFNANGAVGAPQTLTITGGITLEIGSSVCIETAGATGWSSSTTGKGAIMVGWQPVTTPVLACQIGGSTVGSSSTDGCTSLVYQVTGDSAQATYTVTAGAQLQRNGVTDTGTSNVILLLACSGNLYQENNTPTWYKWPNPPTWPAGPWTQIAGDPRLTTPACQ